MRYMVLVMVLAGGCTDESTPQSQCQAPESTTYTCAAQDPAQATSTSCVGGPTWYVHYDETRPAVVESPGVAYADGCHVTVPDCDAFHKGTPRELICYAGHWGEPL